MDKRYWAGLAASVCAATATAAPQASTPTQLSNVVVTATRTPQLRRDDMAATSVITRKDIERSQAQSVAELLDKTPSLSISNSGGAGKQTSLYMRGANNNQVLVLVDGVPWGSASTGQAAIEQFPVSQIQRIEVVRGPRSSLYGADAAGGVIQIFTRDGRGAKGRRPMPYFSGTAGSHHSWKGQGGVSGATQRAHYNFSVSGERTSGIDATDYAKETDHDGYDRVDGSFNAGYRFDNGWSVNGHYLRSEGNNDYDRPPPFYLGSDKNHSVQEVYGLTVAAPLTDIWDSRLSFSRSRDLETDYEKGDYRDRARINTRRDKFSWQNDITLARQQTATLGAEYQQDKVGGSTDYKKDRRGNAGLFGEYQGRFGPHEIDLTGRGDFNQAYGNHATGSITYGYHLNKVYMLTASYGNAFTAPTFNDLYYPDTPGFPPASNPDLKPEKSRTGEIGIKATPEWGHWAIHAYQTDADDQIELDSNFTPRNVAKTRIRGVEGEITAHVERWRIGASADWMQARNREHGAQYNNDLARRPNYSASLDVDRDLFSRFSAGARAKLVGSRYDDEENAHKLGGYARFDLRGEMRVSDSWKVQAKIANLLDHRYATIRHYNQLGRTFYLTVRYAPGDT